MKPILCASLVALGMLGMSFGQTPSNPAAQSASPQRQVPAPGNNQLARMRDDLNKLESLNLNMSSEIEFLHDQNLQILLRTNSQMWTVLIQDLRRQIELNEEHRAVPLQSTEPPHGNSERK